MVKISENEDFGTVIQLCPQLPVIVLVLTFTLFFLSLLLFLFLSVSLPPTNSHFCSFLSQTLPVMFPLSLYGII